MWGALALTLWAGGLGFALAAAFSLRRLKKWQEAAAACGLQVEEASAGLRPLLLARAGQVSVSIRPFTDKGRSAWITVQAPAPLEFRGVRIRPEPMIRLGKEIEVGDRLFDKDFFLEGPPRLLFALLDAETRRLLSEVKEKADPDIVNGELRAVVGADGNVQDVLSALLALSRRLPASPEIARRLVANANHDPDPGVRLQNLLFLTRELSWSPETDGALRQALADPDPRIRLLAARRLGDEGRDVLLKLMERLEDDDVSAEAFMALERELAFEQVSRILSLALRWRRLRTARVCLVELGHRGAEAGVDLIAKVLDREHGELAPVAARALGETGSPAAEPALLQALARDDAELRVAAAEALGRVGTAAAVLPLKEAAADGLFPGELRRAARQAVAEIQSRVQGAAPGQLSLAGGEAGQLSLAQEGGELSLADDPAGRLSIRGDEE